MRASDMPPEALTTETQCKCQGTGWVCENHPEVSFPEGECEDGAGEPCGAGMPCSCNPRAKPIAGSTVIWSAENGYAN